MLKAVGYLAGAPTIAVAGGFLIYAVWDTLIRQGVVPNSTFVLFPVVAVLWACLCLGAGVLLYRRHSQQHMPRREADDPAGETRQQ
jgi:hypothetical protein